MQRSFDSKQVFLIAVAVVLVAALTPMAAGAATKVFKMAGKKGRVVAVDKRGILSVGVRNKPKVAVPDGVAVTNQLSVKVPDGIALTNRPDVNVPDGVAVTNQPSVNVANQPTVNVANQPTDLGVHSSPGSLYADTRPSSRDVVNMHASRLGVGWMPLLTVTAPERAAITELTLTGQGPDGPQVYRIEVWRRKGSTGSCNAPNLTEFDKVVLRQVSIQNYESTQLTFDGAPLLVPPPPAGGDTVCFGVVSIQAPNGSESHVGGTAFRF